MARLGDNSWGKSSVRVSKVSHGASRDEFSEVTVEVRLEGDVEDAFVAGDNSAVLPTDTMRNTVYGLAQDHLGPDLERFGEILCERFLGRPDVHQVLVGIAETLWRRETDTGFIGGGSERRLTRVARGRRLDVTSAGIEGLVVLKTRGSSFTGFPRDEYTILPEATDRILATSITAEWTYSPLPTNPTETWSVVRGTLVDRFFSDWSASVQHQGYIMGEAVLEAVPEISHIHFRLPNQHHLPFDLTRFGLDDHGIVFHPVSEPYGDIELTVVR